MTLQKAMRVRADLKKEIVNLNELIREYPRQISFKDNVLLYYWNPEHYNLAHSYLLWLNKEARNRNIQV